MYASCPGTSLRFTRPIHYIITHNVRKDMTSSSRCITQAIPLDYIINKAVLSLHGLIHNKTVGSCASSDTYLVCAPTGCNTNLNMINSKMEACE